MPRLAQPRRFGYNPRMISVAILTVSDRAARGKYEDRSGPALCAAVEKTGWQIIAHKIVPDSKAAIQKAIRAFVRQGCEVILTTGGTGIAARDVTPEAVRAIARCELPGFGEVIRAESLKITSHALLSRATAFVARKTLVVCLPGSSKGAVECLGFIATAIPHAIELLQEKPTRH